MWKLPVRDNARRGFICGGNWTVDRIKLVDGWPQEEHVAEIMSTDQQGGGSGHNLGVDIRKLDPAMPVEAIAILGNDADGDFMLGKAAQSGIDTSQMHRTSATSNSFTDVISDVVSGKRTFFHHRGTNDLISPEHFDFTAASCQGRILHLGLLGVHAMLDSPWQSPDGETEANGWVAVLKAAQAAGINTNIELLSIAPERIREIARPCLDYLDTLIANEYEIGALADIEVVGANGTIALERCQVAAQKVLDMGELSLVVVHYPEAALALTRDEQYAVQTSFEVDKSIIGSAVGAGDAFAAGMLYGLHENWSLDESLELAHAAAAASLRATNTVGSVESVADCLAFARQFPKREL